MCDCASFVITAVYTLQHYYVWKSGNDLWHEAVRERQREQALSSSRDTGTDSKPALRTWMRTWVTLSSKMPSRLYDEFLSFSLKCERIKSGALWSFSDFFSWNCLEMFGVFKCRYLQKYIFQKVLHSVFRKHQVAAEFTYSDKYRLHHFYRVISISKYTNAKCI